MESVLIKNDYENAKLEGNLEIKSNVNPNPLLTAPSSI
jgi:hypothetical protein